VAKRTPATLKAPPGPVRQFPAVEVACPLEFVPRPSLWSRSVHQAYTRGRDQLAGARRRRSRNKCRNDRSAL